MAANVSFERVALSPREFAALFGKSQTWGYRQIYAGKVKAISEHGRILIPAAEVEAILKTAGVYNGKIRKAARTKAELQQLSPRLQNTWQQFLAARRAAVKQLSGKADSPKMKWPAHVDERRDANASRWLQKKNIDKRRSL